MGKETTTISTPTEMDKLMIMLNNLDPDDTDREVEDTGNNSLIAIISEDENDEISPVTLPTTKKSKKRAKNLDAMIKKKRKKKNKRSRSQPSEIMNGFMTD